MKRSTTLCVLGITLVGPAGILSAQSMPASGQTASPASGTIRPILGTSPAALAGDESVYVVQNADTLNSNQGVAAPRDPRTLEARLQHNASPFLRVPVSTANASNPAWDKNASQDVNFALNLLSAMYRPEAAPVEKDGEAALVLSVRTRVRKDPSKVLEIVATEVRANSDHVCEIVKAAIQGADADPAKCAEIVRTAAETDPESMRIAAQCAIALQPEALTDVQAVLAELDPAGTSRGRSSKDSKDSKDAKDAKDAKAEIAPAAPPPNPLDLPPPGPPIPPVPPPFPPPRSTETGFTE